MVRTASTLRVHCQSLRVHCQSLPVGYRLLWWLPHVKNRSQRTYRQTTRVHCEYPCGALPVTTSATTSTPPQVTTSALPVTTSALRVYRQPIAFDRRNHVPRASGKDKECAWGDRALCLISMGARINVANVWPTQGVAFDQHLQTQGVTFRYTNYGRTSTYRYTGDDQHQPVGLGAGADPM